MERKVCTYCGKEGHSAANCPWRPAKLALLAPTWLAVLLVMSVSTLPGCGKKETPQAVANYHKTSPEARHELGHTFYAVEFKLQDGTLCVASSQGGMTCNWVAR